MLRQASATLSCGSWIKKIEQKYIPHPDICCFVWPDLQSVKCPADSPVRAADTELGRRSPTGATSLSEMDPRVTLHLLEQG